MSIELGRISHNEYGDPTVTITINGHHDFYRVAHHLCSGQCDMMNIGSKMKRRQRRNVGVERWNWLLNYMHGDGGFR